MSTIFIIGIFISLFQFVLLLNKRSKSLPDKILTFWMLVICIHLISYYLNQHGHWEQYPHLVGITVPFPLLYGPLLFLYVLYSLKPQSNFSRADSWHFAPAILSYLYLMPFYFLYSAQEKYLVDTGQIDDYGTFSNVLVIAFIVSGIVYAIYSFQLLKKHQVIIEDNFSHTDKISLTWLRGFIGCIALIFLTAMIVVIARDVMGIHFSFNPDYIFYAILIFAIIILGYYGIRHEHIFLDNEISSRPVKGKASYKKSGLKDDVATEKYQKLLDLMKTQKPYLEPKISLSKLAERLDLSPNILSQIINQSEEENFNDFVNKYRLEEFIEKAKGQTHLSLLALALDSGFNSKSTFNAVFKKHKGMTPSQFLSKES